MLLTKQITVYIQNAQHTGTMYTHNKAWTSFAHPMYNTGRLRFSEIMKPVVTAKH